MQVSTDGLQTYYDPVATARQVHPADGDNDWLDQQEMPREVLVQMQPGLSADDAAMVARAHLARFGEPGVTGTIELTSPTRSMNGVPFPRHLMRAGMAIHMPNLFGRPEGVLLHIAESETDFVRGQTTLTVDTKPRDALTVEEVRHARPGRAVRSPGCWWPASTQPPVPDQMFPWNYAEGSGYIPSNDLHRAAAVQGDAGRRAVPVGGVDRGPPAEGPEVGQLLREARAGLGQRRPQLGDPAGHPRRPVRRPDPDGQSGQIRLLQIAAYDEDGHVLRVPFHFSLFTIARGQLPVDAADPGRRGYYAPALPTPTPPASTTRSARRLRALQRRRHPDQPEDPAAEESAGLVRAYGTYYEKAGYWPGSYAEGDEPTGLLVDESTWAFDLTAVRGRLLRPVLAEGEPDQSRWSATCTR